MLVRQWRHSDEHTLLKVDHLGLLYYVGYGIFERLMRRVVIDIVVPVLVRIESKNEDMSDPVLRVSN